MKHNVGDKVHAKVLGTREKTNASGAVVYIKNAKGVMETEIEEFTMREFDGEITNSHQRKEGDGVYVAHKVTCPDLDRGGYMWVEEKFLTAAPTSQAKS